MRSIFGRPLEATAGSQRVKAIFFETGNGVREVHTDIGRNWF